jgi:hypothetical protein
VPPFWSLDEEQQEAAIDPILVQNHPDNIGRAMAGSLAMSWPSRGFLPRP